MNVHASPPWPTAPNVPARAVDPIVLQIVEGTLNSIEAEIEYAIERTARSPMIREAHDYRVGLFDRYCRKLTGPDVAKRFAASWAKAIEYIKANPKEARKHLARRAPRGDRARQPEAQRDRHACGRCRRAPRRAPPRRR